MTTDRVAERRFRLFEDRQRLESLMDDLRTAATSRDAYEPHDITDDEAALQADMIATRLRAIDTALRRIETGEYALCRACGSAISDVRLDALPATSLCRGCV